MSGENSEITNSTQKHFDSSEQRNISQNPAAADAGAGAGMFIPYENTYPSFFSFCS